MPAQLPLEAPGFSGRRAELERMLQEALPGASRARPGRRRPDLTAGNDPTVPIVVISGTAGIGKTALAIRFGRQVAKRFPDGQLYVNLRGLDPSASAMSPPRRCGSSSTRWACRRTGCRSTSRAGPPCSAACWTASGC